MSEVVISRPRIMVAVPHGGMLNGEFVSSLVDAFCYAKHFADVYLALKQSSVIDRNRNELAHAAVYTGMDAVMWFDSDMKVPINVIHVLWEHQKSIVGGAYPNRVEPVRQVGEAKDGLPLKDEGLREMDYLGFGCVMVKVDVLRNMKGPWFKFEYHGDSLIPSGEDTYFCRQAQSLGYTVWCDQALSKDLVHIGSRNLSLSNLGMIPA